LGRTGHAAHHPRGRGDARVAAGAAWRGDVPGVCRRRPVLHPYTPGGPGRRLVRATARAARVAAGEDAVLLHGTNDARTRRANMISRRAFVSALAASACMAFGAAVHAQTVLTVSGWTPPRHHFTQLMQNEWAPMVERESGGLLKIRYLPRAPMGAAQTFDGVRDGLVDISFIAHGYTSGRFTLTKIAEMPFLADNAETLSVAYQRVFERRLAQANEHDGVIPLAMFTPGPGHLMSPGEPFDGVASVQGKKIRAPGGTAFQLAEALGAAPLSRPARELYELLNGGIVDGAFMPADVFGGWRLEDLIKSVTTVP